MEDDRLIDCGGMHMVVGGGGGGGGGGGRGGGAFVTFNPRRPFWNNNYLNLWIYHRSLLVNYLLLFVSAVSPCPVG